MEEFLWMLRMKQAVNVELPKARWIRNPRWLAQMLADTVASLWGHLGSLRHQLLRPAGMARLQ